MGSKLLKTTDIFTRGVETIITEKELKEILDSGRPLRIKHGIDATGNLHIGHAANLWKLRMLQEEGHKAVILLGDVTTTIGDPTGKMTARPALDEKTINANIKNIERQLKKILLTDPKVFELHKSSEWYGKMRAPEFLKILSLITHARLMERDMFQARIKKGEEIHVHEFLYPVLQGYDSVALRADVTIIGSDQLFNEHMGRFFQEKFGQKPQVLIALKILPGLDGGEKMSKTLGNYIGLEESPENKFGKAMRIPDSLIIPYLEVYTDVPLKEVALMKKEMEEGRNPMEVKLLFAEALVRRYHGAGIAASARESFLRIFSQKDLSEVPEARIGHGEYSLLDLLLMLKLITSKTEGRRLVSQGAVEVDGSSVRDPHDRITTQKGMVIKVGKRRFFRLM